MPARDDEPACGFDDDAGSSADAADDGGGRDMEFSRPEDEIATAESMLFSSPSGCWWGCLDLELELDASDMMSVFVG